MTDSVSNFNLTNSYPGHDQRDYEFASKYGLNIKPVILALILATGINMLLKSTGYVSLSEYDVNIPAIIILCLLAGIYFFIRRKWKQKLSAISLILLSAVLGIVVSVIAEHIR